MSTDTSAGDVMAYIIFLCSDFVYLAEIIKLN